MKFNFLTAAVVIIAVILSSCKKPDTVEPYLSLKGDNPMTIVLNQNWEDPGCKADDNKDGDITSRVEVTHDIPITGIENGEGPTTKKGTYSVIYSIKDEAGNKTSKTRIVNVVNSAEKYMGQYNATRVSHNNNTNIAIDYTNLKANLTADNNSNWKFKFPKLSNIDGLKVDAYISKLETGATPPSSFTVPGGHLVSMFETEITQQDLDGVDTIRYKVYGEVNTATQIQLGSLDTTGTNGKYVIEIIYNIEMEYPYDASNPYNPANIQSDKITETYVYKY